MLSVTDYPKHADYVVDLLFERKDRQFWNDLFDVPRGYVKSGNWEAARQCLRKAMGIAKSLEYDMDIKGLRRRAGIDLLLGACYCGDGDLAQALHHYEYAVGAFVDGTDDYGNAIFVYAKALALHAKGDWAQAYMSYAKALDLLEKSYIADSAAVRMRVDLKAQFELVKNILFTYVPDPDPPAIVPDVPNDSTGDAPSKPGPVPKPPKSPKGPPPPMGPDYATFDGFFKLFPIYQDISAGPGIWLQEYQDLHSFVEITQLTIDGAPFLFKSMKKDDRALQWNRHKNYGVFRIKGDSMNAEDIVEGDYVLAEEVRLSPLTVDDVARTNDADLTEDGYGPTEPGGRTPASVYDGQIMCIALDSDGQKELVVKRFNCSGTEVTLTSRNKQEKYEPQTYEITEIAILGKVVAILKKIE